MTSLKNMTSLLFHELDTRLWLAYSGLGKCCNVWQFWIIYSVVLYSVEIPLSFTERK
jgi:hypothetical protein